MKNIFLWLSGLLTIPALGHLARFFFNARIDVAWTFAKHYHHYRVPFSPSLTIGIICLLLAIIFYLLSKNR
jgi:hypothetical protein